MKHFNPDHFPVRLDATYVPMILAIVGSLFAGCSDRATSAASAGTTSSDSTQIVIEAEEPAELWINGKKLGPLPMTFEPRGLKRYFLPEFDSAVQSNETMDAALEEAERTAEGGVHSSTTGSDRCQITCWKRGQDQDSVWLVRAVVPASEPPATIAGGFLVRVAAADGTELESSGGSSSGVGAKSTVRRSFSRHSAR